MPLLSSALSSFFLDSISWNGLISRFGFLHKKPHLPAFQRNDISCTFMKENDTDSNLCFVKIFCQVLLYRNTLNVTISGIFSSRMQEAFPLNPMELVLNKLLPFIPEVANGLNIQPVI